MFIVLFLQNDEVSKTTRKRQHLIQRLIQRTTHQTHQQRSHLHLFIKDFCNYQTVTTLVTLLSTTLEAL